jgi:CheY-like chemotaxis protein
MTAVDEPSVLVIEDDEDVAETLAEALSDQGYRIICAANGADALALLRSGQRPSVILLDMMMPVMDGREFRDLQREDPELADIPVIVLTANVSAGAVVAEMNVTRFLKKPVRLDELLDAVADASAERGGAERLSDRNPE